MGERCEKPIGCGRYLDGLTDGAEAHPIYNTLCVACGTALLKEDGWSKAEQQRREKAVYGVTPGAPDRSPDA